jgi:predicted MFS family arabinose efflux permease
MQRTGQHEEAKPMREPSVDQDAKAAYLGELLLHWRLLIGAFVGMGLGFAFAPYIYGVMGPHLIQEFGWARSDFALSTVLMLVTVFVYPVIGRLNDVLGVRRTAIIGVIALPAGYLAFAMQTGSLPVYMGIMLFQSCLGITTTAIVYTRVIVHSFRRARGLALGIVAAGPALAGALLAPLFNEYVETNGWRAGYILIAIASALAGIFAVLTLPSHRAKRAADAPLANIKATGADYKEIFRNKAFWLMVFALFFINVPLTIILSQLNVLLLENGVQTGDASIMIAAFAVGTLLGRLLCGAAIDRWPAHIVAAASMSTPAIGLLLFASDFDAPTVLTFATFVIGFAHGAESDAMGYIVSKTFATRIYSSVFSFMSAAMGISSAVGAILLSVTLAATNCFTVFLCVSAASVLIGSFLFLILGPPPALTSLSGSPRDEG